MPNRYDYRELRELINANHDRFSELNFDTSMSLQQKMNALVEWFKVILKEYDDWLNYLDDFKDNFDDKLYSNIEDILRKWVDDGFFEEIIAKVVARIGDLNSFRSWDNTVIEKVKNEFSERAINLKWFDIFPDGSDVSEKLNAALATGGNFFLPKGDYYISKPITWDIAKTVFRSNGAKLIATSDFPSNQYMAKPISTSYDDRTFLKQQLNGGFSLIGDYSGKYNGLYIGNPKDNGTRYVFAHMIWDNIYIQGCNIGLHLDDNTYMIEFFHCYTYDNVINLDVVQNFNNAGERVSFIGCDFTGSSKLLTSKCLNVLGYWNLYFENCSFDWMEILGVNWGDMILVNCHIETPSTKLSRVLNGEEFFKLEYNGQFQMVGGLLMINNNSSAVEKIDHLFTGTSGNQGYIFDNTMIKVKNLHTLVKGSPDIKALPKIVSGYSDPSDYNYLLSTNVRNNFLVDPTFSKKNDVTTLIDGWAIESNAIFSLQTIDGFRSLVTTANGNAPRTPRIYLKIPIASYDYIAHSLDIFGNNANSIIKVEMELYADNILLGSYDMPTPVLEAQVYSNYRCARILKTLNLPKNRITHVRMVYWFNILAVGDFVAFKAPIINAF